MTENEKMPFYKTRLTVCKKRLDVIEHLFNYGSDDLCFTICNSAREELFRHYLSFPQARQVLEALHKVILAEVTRLSKLIYEWEKNTEK